MSAGWRQRLLCPGAACAPRGRTPPSRRTACRLRELCVKLMFLHPVDYGRKAEELLWRKVYYEVIQLIKTNRKHIHSRSTLECAYRTHLVAGIGFYQHLLLYIQSHYQLELQCCIDWTHVTDPLIGQCAARPSGLVELVAQPGAEPSSTTRRCW